MVDHGDMTKPTPPARLRFLILGALIAVGALITGACGLTSIRGSGNVVSEEFDVSDFDRVDVGGAWDASIKHADEPRLIVHIDDNLLERVEVDFDNGHLSVGFKGNLRLSNTTMALTIETPTLSEVEASGASDVVVSGFTQSAFTLAASGASTVVADVQTERLELDVDGASTVVLDGTAEEVEVDVNGASNADLSDLVVSSASIDVNGASALNVTGASEVSGDVNGVSNVTVSQAATTNVETNGLSDLDRE